MKVDGAVVHQQNLDTRQPFASCRCRAARGLEGLHIPSPKGSSAQKQLPTQRAVHAHTAAHVFHQLPHDGQAQPRAAEASRGRGIRLRKRREEPVLHISRDARRCPTPRTSSDRPACPEILLSRRSMRPRSVNLSALPSRFIST